MALYKGWEKTPQPNHLCLLTGLGSLEAAG